LEEPVQVPEETQNASEVIKLEDSQAFKTVEPVLPRVRPINEPRSFYSNIKIK